MASIRPCDYSTSQRANFLHRLLGANVLFSYQEHDVLNKSERVCQQMSAAACRKRANPIRMRDLARFTLCYAQIFAWHGSPGDVRRASASPAIDAMTIAQGKRDAPQHVSCPAANASTTQLHLFDSSLFIHLLSVIRIILFPFRNLVLP